MRFFKEWNSTYLTWFDLQIIDTFAKKSASWNIYFFSFFSVVTFSREKMDKLLHSNTHHNIDEQINILDYVQGKNISTFITP